MFKTDESGQAHVIESIAAGILIITVVIFAIQATAITPLTVSTSNQHIETQQQRMADGILETAKTDGKSAQTDAETPGQFEQPFDYSCDVITALDRSPGARTSHMVSMNITGNAVGNSLNDISIEYSSGSNTNASDVPDPSLDSIVAVGIDKTRNGILDKNVTDDVEPYDFRTEDNDETLVIEFTGNYNLDKHDQLVFIFDSVVNPDSPGDYTVDVDVDGDKVYSGDLEIGNGTDEPPCVSESQARGNVLKNAVLYWNTSQQKFYNASSEGYLGEYPNNEFGEMLNETFSSRNIATNIYVTYQRPGGGSATQQMVKMGSPSDNAVTATTDLVLYNDDKITAPSETKALTQTDAYFAEDVNSNSNIYNVVEVRIVVWRI